MSFCTEHTPDCLTCYEGTLTDCQDLTITTDLIEGEIYWLQLYDKFDNVITSEITIGVDGALTITPPDGWGKIYFYLSTEEEPGTADVAVTINETEYYCFIYE